MKIDIVIIDLTRQKPIEVKECSITLEENHFEYVAIFKADEFQSEVEDEEFEKLKEDQTQWIESITDFRYFGFRRDILGVERTYLDNLKIHMVSLKTRDTNIKIYYKKLKEANEMYDKLKEWAYGFK